MDNVPEIFKFQSKQVRVVEESGKVWFVLKDVSDILGFSHLRQHLESIEEDEKGVKVIDTLGGAQKLNVINESGVYGLSFRSRKPEAKRFRKWVTSEVLPTIRKTGGYVSPGATADQLKVLVDTITEQAGHIAELSGDLDRAIKAIDVLKPKSPYGEISDRTGAPKVDLTSAYFRSPRNGREFESRFIQLLLPLFQGMTR